MDSINFIKGYGKVQDLELQHQSPNPNTNTQKKPLVIAVSILAILFLSLTLDAMFGVLVHMAASDPPDLPSSSSSNSAEHDTDLVIKAVCNMTRYPDSCFSSITSSCSSPQKFTDPEAIFKLSFRVTIVELSNFKNTMISNSNQGTAFTDCQSQIKDTVSRLNNSVVAMKVRDRGERVRNERQGREMRDKGERVRDERQGREMRDRGERVRDGRQNRGERVGLNIIIFLQYLL